MEKREFWRFNAALGKWKQSQKTWIGIHSPAPEMGLHWLIMATFPCWKELGIISRCSLPCCNSKGFTFPGSRPSSPGYLWLLPELPMEFGEGQCGNGKSPADKHLDPAIVIPKGAAGERWGGTRDAPSGVDGSKGMKSLDSCPSRPPAGLIPAGGGFPLTSLGKHSLLSGSAGSEALDTQD